MRDQNPQLAGKREGEEDYHWGVGGAEERKKYKRREEQDDGEGACVDGWVEACCKGEGRGDFAKGNRGQGWSSNVEFGNAGESRLEVYLWEGWAVCKPREERCTFIGGGVEVRTAGVGGRCSWSFGVCKEGVAGGSHSCSWLIYLN